MKGSIPLFKDITPLRTIINSTVADFILPYQKWNIQRIYQVFTPASARTIKSMELPRDETTGDMFYWMVNKLGKYTTKSSYNVAMQQQQNNIYNMTTPRHMKFFWVIWSLSIMPKWKLFLWKLKLHCYKEQSVPSSYFWHEPMPHLQLGPGGLSTPKPLYEMAKKHLEHLCSKHWSLP